MTLEEALELIKKLETSVKNLETKAEQADESVTKLQNKNAELLSEKKEIAKKKAEAEQAKAEAEEKIANEKGDFQKLLEIAKAKNLEKIKALETTNAKRYAQIKAQTLDNQIDKIAIKLGGDSDNAEMLTPHIEKRLKLEETDSGEIVVKVLDSKGELTAKTIEELEEEFRTTPKYAKNIVGRKSNGGGSGGDEGGAGGSGEDDYEKFFKKETRNVGKIIELKSSNPQEYERLNKKYPAEFNA